MLTYFGTGFFFFFLVKESVISLYRNTEDSATRIFANSETWRMGVFDEQLLTDITVHTGSRNRNINYTKLNYKGHVDIYYGTARPIVLIMVVDET